MLAAPALSAQAKHEDICLIEGVNSPVLLKELGGERIRFEADVPVMAVGGIAGMDHAHTLVAAGRADLCAIARGHLDEPYLTLQGANRYGVADFAWPKQYLAARKRAAE